MEVLEADPLAGSFLPLEAQAPESCFLPAVTALRRQEEAGFRTFLLPWPAASSPSWDHDSYR